MTCTRFPSAPDPIRPSTRVLPPLQPPSSRRPPDHPRLHPPPVVCIVTDQEWWQRSLDSILTTQGYSTTATAPAQLADRLQVISPDALLVQVNAGTGRGVELLGALRADPGFDPSTPILFVRGDPYTRKERVEALGAGAWGCYSLPLDTQELLLQLERFCAAKRETTRARDDEFLQRGTGLYATPAFMRIANVLGLLATRHARPFGCVMFGFQSTGGTPDVGGAGMRPWTQAAMERFARILQFSGRASDIMGHYAPGEVAVFASDTGLDGCTRLAERMLAAIDSVEWLPRAEAGAAPVRPVAGCAAWTALDGGAADPAAVLARASFGLQRIQRQPGLDRIEVVSAPFRGGLTIPPPERG